jgi:hypothetical protein
MILITPPPPTHTFYCGPRLENTNQHPWKLSREQCIFSPLRKLNIRTAADIGVDDMFYTKKLQSFVTGQVYAVDILFPADETRINDIICVNDISKLPDNIDCLIMMDVLEHVEDDRAFFNMASGKLSQNGIIVITVPAYQFLFSVHDVRSSHFRRYNKRRLITLIKRDNIIIEKCHYFYTCLLFIRLLSLLRKKNFAGDDISWDYPEKHILTRLIKTILNIDFQINRFFARLHIYLPGLSIFAICKKVA